MRRPSKRLAIVTLFAAVSAFGVFWAAASSLSVGSNDLAVNAGATTLTTTPTYIPSSLALNNVGNSNTAGKIEKGDTIVVTFPASVNPGTICAGKTTTFTLNGSGAGGSLIVTVKNDFVGGHDAIIVSQTAQCTDNNLGFASGGTGSSAGYIDLGPANWVTADTTFGASGSSSTFKFDASTNTVTVTLGNASGSTATITASQTATYVPDSSIANTAGTHASGSTSVTGTLF